LNGAQEIEPQNGRAFHLIAIRFGTDLLAGVTDFFSSEIDSPPFLGRLGDGADVGEGNWERRGPELAPQEKDVHEAPEENDGYMEKSLHKKREKIICMVMGMSGFFKLQIRLRLRRISLGLK